MSEKKSSPGLRVETDIFKSLVQKYLPYVPVFVLVVSICLAVAYLYSKWAIKSYEITATVLIQDQKKGMDESKMLEALDVFKGQKIVENEVEVLHSRALMKQVIKNLGLYADITEKHRFRTLSIYSNAPFYIRAKDPEKMVTVENVPFQYDADKRKVIIEGKEYPLNQWVNTKWGDLSFLSNNNYNPPNPLPPYSFSLQKLKNVEERLLSSLDVMTLNKLASLVTLKLKDSDAKRGEDILNELLALYTKAEVEDKNILAGNILASVENRLRYVSGQLDSVESAIQRYRSDAGVIDISRQGQLYLENVGQYDKQLQDVNIKLAVLDEVERYINSKSTSTAIMPSALGVEDPSLSQMLTRLNDSQMEYDRLKKTTAENSPLLVGVREQVTNLRPAISDLVTNQRRSLQITKENLTRTSGRYNAMLGSIPQKEKQLLEISRQQSIKNEIYSYLLQRREEAALSYATAKADSKVVDLAESSSKHVSPKMSVIYLASMIFGTMLTALFINLKEGFNKKVLFRKEMEEILPVPVIGELVHQRHHSPVVYQDQEKSFIVEQFRALRNALTIGTGKENNRVIYVTSALEGDGKSFVSINLAISIASLGKKTVLVDLDVDHNKVTGSTELAGRKGVSDYIRHVAGISEIVHKSSLHPYLSVVPIGTGDQSGLEISGTEEVAALFESLRRQFDYVVISSGSITINANAAAVAAFADTSLFVVRQGKTPKSALAMLSNEDRIKNLSNPYVVFNDVRKRGWMSEGYGVEYGYGYELKPKL